MKLLLFGLILRIVILREIRAREAIASIPDVGQIIKDLDGLQIDGATFERGKWTDKLITIFVSDE